ncbi:hypothetical protein GCM10009096_01810 [Parasphingorhabdus litoris]|uniref:Uncharacterized protein n=1 Tax=Parasphingorhabdus litoris TaxID=394733 RepID=A0ABP3JUV3_9SPHN
MCQKCGPDYLGFKCAGVDGGFNSEDDMPVQKLEDLLVLFSKCLEASLTKLKAAGTNEWLLFSARWIRILSVSRALNLN